MSQPRFDIPGTFVERVRRGMAFGLLMAALFSLYVTGLRVFRGVAPFNKLGATYSSVVLAYFAGGALTGGVVGGLWPLRRRRSGAAVVSGIGGFVAYAAIGVTIEGNPLRWTMREWSAPTLLGLFWAVLGATLFFQTPSAVVPPPAASRLRTVRGNKPRDPEP